MSQNPEEQAQQDNLQNEAEQHQTAQETDKLYAGKFKSVEDMEKSYLELQKTFHAKTQERPPAEETTTNEVSDVDKYVESKFEAFAKQKGLLTRAEVEAERHEKEQLDIYLAQDPSAKERLDLIKTLANTEKFKGKSFADVDAFIKGQTKAKVSKETKPVAMGSQSDSDEVTDDDFRRAVGLGKGQRPSMLFKKSAS